MLDLAKRVLTRMVPLESVWMCPTGGARQREAGTMRNALRIARLIAHKLIADMRKGEEWNVTTYRAKGLPTWMIDNMRSPYSL